MPKGWKWSDSLAPPGKQNDYRTFCMSDETEKVYYKLEEAIGVC